MTHAHRVVWRYSKSDAQIMAQLSLSPPFPADSMCMCVSLGGTCLVSAGEEASNKDRFGLRVYVSHFLSQPPLPFPSRLSLSLIFCLLSSCYEPRRWRRTDWSYWPDLQSLQPLNTRFHHCALDEGRTGMLWPQCESTCQKKLETAAYIHSEKKRGSFHSSITSLDL